MLIQKKRSFAKEKNCGFSLIELMIVLAIVGFALAAIIGVSLSAYNDSKVKTELSNLQAISSSVKGTFGATGSYAGLTVASIIAAGGFPVQMIEAGIPKDSWGGATSLAVTTIGTSGFDIGFPSVPQSSCIKLGSKAINMFENMKIGGTAMATSAWTAALISSTCASGPNSMVFNAV